MNETLGVSLLVAVVVLILKALWDLKTGPTGGDVKRAVEVRSQLDKRLEKIENDLRFVRDRVLENRSRHRRDDDTYDG